MNLYLFIPEHRTVVKTLINIAFAALAAFAVVGSAACAIRLVVAG